MRRGLVWVGILILVALPALAQDPLFDRPAFIERVRGIFGPLEDKLLGDLDRFDYEATMLFSGVVNGSQEHVVVVPLTSGSHSVDLARNSLGSTITWNDLPEGLPLFGLLILEPTDCIHGLEHRKPYLAVGTSWDRAQIITENRVFVRNFVTWWRRGDPTPAYFKFSGNMEIHLETCGTASSNQW